MEVKGRTNVKNKVIKNEGIALGAFILCFLLLY